MKKILIVLVALLTLAAVPVSAQTYLTSTTLSSAITSKTSDSLTLTATTNVEVGGSLYIDHELFGVTAINGLRITVSRTQRPALHLSGATVIVAKQAQKSLVFIAHESAQSLTGACTPGNYQFLPIVDTDWGDVYLCWSKSATYGRIWSRTNLYPQNGTPSILLNLQ